MDAQYFIEIQDSQTYRGQPDDFHYEYNANSGGGQSFLAGFSLAEDGTKKQTSNLSGRTAYFAISKGLNGIEEELIRTDTDEDCLYLIVPRGSNSAQMKLSIGQKIRPSLAVSAFFMLPSTCVKNSSIRTESSPLTLENYWLESMWMSYREDISDRVMLIPKDFIFSGGVSKGTSKEARSPRHFQLQYERRINDILSIELEFSGLPNAAIECVSYFQDLYTSAIDFNYKECASRVSDLMVSLAQRYPMQYSGYSDPLPFIMEQTRKIASANEKVPKNNIDTQGLPRNLIYFGAPGTGKSFELNSRAHALFAPDNIRRITFHPEYSHSQFVGSYKPVSRRNKETGDYEILYDFVLGPFMESLIDATNRSNERHLLVIEEINRANPGAVFGDVFQLLDRDSSGNSVYEVDLSQELGEALEKRLSSRTPLLDQESTDKRLTRIKLPSNLFIWATMNSADQGVFPMDTAFKRRWDFKYMHINAGSELISGINVPIGPGNRIVNWDHLRRSINELLTRAKVEEDRLIGPFFLPPASLEDPSRFPEIFKEKVLLYIFEDIAKTKRDRIFAPNIARTYSSICSEFDSIGENVFADIVHVDDVVMSGDLSASTVPEAGANTAGRSLDD